MKNPSGTIPGLFEPGKLVGNWPALINHYW
jgi:hypothetical protein